MRKRNTVLALGLLGAGAYWWARRQGVSRHPVGNPDVPEPRKGVDIDRYLGVWHEVARYEQTFEKGCRSATAEYTRRDDGLIAIRNSCQTADGRISAVEGRAKPADPSGFAKLKVSFFGPFFVGDYWVLDHADDYSWSIVGEPSGRALWLLSRERGPDETLVAMLFERARTLGYDVSMLLRSQPLAA